MNVCIIDIGSNTVKASIYKVRGKYEKCEIAYRGNKEKLITYIDDTRIMSEDGIKVLCASIKNLLRFSEEYKCEKIFAFATASLRNVLNKDEILHIIEDKFGILIELLSEEEEALYSLKGLLSNFEASKVNKGIMVDMGGGSTELVMFENGKEPKISSMNFGCLSLLDFDISQKNFEKNILQKVRDELKKCEFAKACEYPVFLIGGTARAILKIINHFKDKDGVTLKSDGSDFKFIFSEYYKEYFQDFLTKELPSRKTTVFSGAISYGEIMKFICPVSIVVSDSGVRDGYLEKILP